MTEIDLDSLTGHGEVHSLSGHPKGLKAREHFNLDVLDNDQSVKPIIIIPEHVYGISPSFVQGFLTASLRRFDNDQSRFFAHYQFRASDLAMKQIKRGLRRILTDRNLSVH